MNEPRYCRKNPVLTHGVHLHELPVVVRGGQPAPGLVADLDGLGEGGGVGVHEVGLADVRPRLRPAGRECARRPVWKGE